MENEIETQDQEAHRVPNKINLKRNMPQNILTKLTKIKHIGKLIKASRENQQIIYKGIPMRSTAELSAETLQARRKWQDIFKVTKGKSLQPRLLYPARISFRFEGKIKSFIQVKAIRIQHHQISLHQEINAKETSLDRKQREREDLKTNK